MRIASSLRAVMTGMAVTISVAALPAAAANAAPAHVAGASRVGIDRPSYNYGPWTVENSPGTYDSSPNPNYSNGVSVANGTRVSLDCYYYGAPAGPYGDPLWYEVGFDYWINDHYLNTPGTAASPQPQTPVCYGAGTGAGVGYSATFHAENSPGTWGNSPTAAIGTSSIQIGGNDTIGLDCYYYGNPTGPYGNTLWYLAYDLTNNTYGWINDHYLNTPGTAASPQPQTSRC